MWIEVLGGEASRPLPMARMAAELGGGRPEERRLAYCECHDQAIVGDSSLSYRMIGEEMLKHMSLDSPPTPTVARALALHKASRLITYALGGGAYLTFSGNEFGHPHWVEMPCERNGHSFDKARRRWDIADDRRQRYSQLLAFEGAMHALEDKLRWMGEPQPVAVADDPQAEGEGAPHRVKRAAAGELRFCERRQLLWFARGGVLFVCNLHPERSVDELLPSCGLEAAFEPTPLLNSDDEAYGGGGRRARLLEACPSQLDTAGGGHQVHVQAPPYAVCVFVAESVVSKCREAETWRRR